MHEITLAHPADFPGWRAAARRLLAAEVAPELVAWSVDEAQSSLFEPSELAAAEPASSFSVPRHFVRLAEQAAVHADPHRFALLYRLLWRMAHGERELLRRATDRDVARLEALAAAVRRCAHKMKAFLRFKEVVAAEGPVYVGWFEPEHHVVELTAPFFARRFATMRWAIVTPYRSARWDGADLVFGPGGRRRDVPAEDALDASWRAYYASIFNPARLNLRAMRREMPKKYWANMPETRLIAPLTATATARAGAMVAQPASEPARKGRVVALPHARHRSAVERTRPATLAEARAAAAACQACPLWGRATQTVFGEGPRDAPVMLVGEQPGDQEDLIGRPFVGPAGEVLDRALADAGLERPALYLTNAVKHFKYALRGKRRLHQSPDVREVEVCRQWLDVERALVRPRLIVALGVTAASALLERPVALQLERGRVRSLPDGSGHVLVTAHPSFVLRQVDPAAQGREYRRLIADLLLAIPYVRRAA